MLGSLRGVRGVIVGVALYESHGGRCNHSAALASRNARLAALGSLDGRRPAVASLKASLKTRLQKLASPNARLASNSDWRVVVGSVTASPRKTPIACCDWWMFRNPCKSTDNTYVFYQLFSMFRKLMLPGPKGWECCGVARSVCT